jgi:hypothetical protein
LVDFGLDRKPAMTTAAAAAASAAPSLDAQLYALLNRLFALDPAIDELGFVLDAAPECFDAAQKQDDEDDDDETKQATNNNKADSYALIVHAMHALRAAFTKAADDNEEEEFCVPFILHEHKLGIAYWCIPVLFKYAVQQFNNNNNNNSSSDKLLESTRCIVLINADHYTAWNARKRLMLSGALSEHDELRLSSLVFSKHPKSGEAWAHRRWALLRLAGFRDSLGTTGLSSKSNNKSTDAKKEAQQVVSFESELDTCQRAAECYPKNYYAWTHRQWLVKQMCDVAALRTELKRVRAWNTSNVSDYCGFHHRLTVCARLMALETTTTTTTKAVALLLRELAFVRELEQLHASHESIWCYKRMLFTHLVRCDLQQAKQQLLLLSNNGAAAGAAANRFARAYRQWCVASVSGVWPEHSRIIIQ